MRSSKAKVASLYIFDLFLFCGKISHVVNKTTKQNNLVYNFYMENIKMKKSLLVLLVSGLALSANVAIAGGHSNSGNGGSRLSGGIIKFATNNPQIIQKAAGTIESIPPAQAAMDAAMVKSPQANSLMTDVQQAGGFTPSN